MFYFILFYFIFWFSQNAILIFYFNFNFEIAKLQPLLMFIVMSRIKPGPDSLKESMYATSALSCQPQTTVHLN